MKISEGSVLVIPLAALLTFFWPGLKPNTPEMPSKLGAQATAGKTPGQLAASKTTQTQAIGNAAKLIYQFLGVPAAVYEKCQKREQCPTEAELAAKYELEFLVATTPNPKTSGLSYSFDHHLDALQRGIAAAGYILDRFELPWLEKSQGQGQSGGDASGQEGNDGAEAREPGVLLFRPRTSETKEKPEEKPQEKSEAKKKLLVVLLVGETPTTGLDKVMLSNALDQVAKLSGWSRKLNEPLVKPPCLPETAAPISPHAKLRLLGPFFSGSAESLALTLRRWRASFHNDLKPSVRIISGNVLGVNKGELLKLLCGSGACTDADFHALVVPSRLAQETFIAYLQKLDPRLSKEDENPKIAILSESNTALGQSTQPPDQSAKSEEAKKPTPSAKPDETKKPASPKITKLTFPLHIAQLRSAAANVDAKRADKAANVSWIETTTQRVPLSMEDGSQTRHVVPPFSQLGTASAELVLTNLLAQIQREQYRYIGILATDVRDRIFLAQEIRTHCPNAALFTFNADLLYLHPKANLAMRGMLIATTYPLYNPNQLWTPPLNRSRGRLHFPAQASEGVYNAALALLGQQQEMLEYDSPFGASPTDQAGKPALWVTVVGRHSFLPVTVLKYKDENNHLFNSRTDLLSLQTKPKGEPVKAPEKIAVAETLHSEASLAMLLLLSFICLIPFVGLLAAPPPSLVTRVERWEDRLSKRQSWPFAALRDLLSYWMTKTRRSHVPLLSKWFSEPLTPALCSESKLYLLSCCANLLALYLLVGAVYFLPTLAQRGWLGAPWNLNASWEIGGEYGPVFGLIVFGLIVLSLLVAALSRMGALWQTLIGALKPQPAEAAESGSAKLSAVLGTLSRATATLCFRLLFPLISFALLCWFIWEIARREPVEMILFCLRAADWMSGVSPLLPLFFVGVAGLLWTSSALRRVRLLNVFECPSVKEKCPPPFLHFDVPSLASLKEMETQIKDLLMQREEHLHFASLTIVFPIIGFACWRLFRVQFVPTVEGRAFDLLFGFAFFMVALALSLSFLRFILVWRVLRRMLRHLSQHPLRLAFSGLKEAEAGKGKVDPGMPKIDLTAPATPFATLAFSVDQANWLWQLTERISNGAGSAQNPQPQEPPTEPSSPDAGHKDFRQQIAQLKDSIRTSVTQVEEELSHAQQADAQDQWREALRWRCCAQDTLAQLVYPVARILESYWCIPCPPPSAMKELAKAEEAWAQQAEYFLASRVVAFLQYILAHLHNLVVFVTSGLLLMLLAVTSYPFQPRDLMLLFNWSVVLSVVGVTVMVFAQMSRDNILSTLANTTPGQVNLTRSFVSKVLVHALVPILALLGAQFPEALRWLLSWVSGT